MGLCRGAEWQVSKLVCVSSHASLHACMCTAGKRRTSHGACSLTSMTIYRWPRSTSLVQGGGDRVEACRGRVEAYLDES